MANEIETITNKKLFDRWKDNFKDFFIEDDKTKGPKNKEENENMVEANGDDTQVEPVDKVMEKAEEKMIEHLSPVLTNGKEDLEGIPEVEEEETVEEKQDGEKTNRDIEVVENEVDLNENIADMADHAEDGTDVDSNEESFLIKETVEENANQNSKTPFFKILANFPFMKKKVSDEQTAVEVVTPVDYKDKDDKSNGLPSYNEAVNQQGETPQNEAETDKEATKMKFNQLPNVNSNANDGTDVVDKENGKDSEISPPQESSEHNNGDIDGQIGHDAEEEEQPVHDDEEEEQPVHDDEEEEQPVHDDKEATHENPDVNQVIEEPKQEEKKFRFRFQFFTDKK